MVKWLWQHDACLRVLPQRSGWKDGVQWMLTFDIFVALVNVEGEASF